MNKIIPILVALVAVSGCSNYRTPTAPSTVSLAGTVTSQSGEKLSAATVRIGNGPNAGKFTTTSADGGYRFDDLVAGSGNVSAVAEGFEPVITTTNIDGTTPLNFTLRTTAPWRMDGTGNATFDLPSYIARIHLNGSYSGFKSRFVVHAGNCLLVEDELGTGALRTVSDGIYPVTPALTPSSGGVKIEVESPDVSWSFAEDRSTTGGVCFGY